MQLRTYMEDQGLTLARMGEMIAAVEPKLDRPVREGTVRRHLNGISEPSPDYRRRYEVATRGMVTPRDWTDLQLAVRANPDLATNAPRLARRRVGAPIANQKENLCPAILGASSVDG